MKKLMLATAIVCAAAFVNAATVKWTTNAMTLPKDNTGTYGTTTLGTLGDGSLYYITESQYTTWLAALNANVATGSKTIYDALSSKTADKTAISAKGKFTLTDGRDVSAATTDDPVDLYAAVIYTYEDGDDIWYVANVGTQHFEANVNGSLANLESTVGGTGGSTAITGWQAVESVPEPFSGALALLGMGAIALRRKMKKAKKA